MDETFASNLAEILKQLDERVEVLEHSVNDVIIQSLKEASDEYEYDDGLEAFKGKYAGISDLEADLKALHGDDFDTYKTFYDSARKHSKDEGYDEEAFVNGTIDELKKRFGALRGPKVQEVEVKAEGEEPKKDEEGKDSDDFPSEEELAKELADIL